MKTWTKPEIQQLELSKTMKKDNYQKLHKGWCDAFKDPVNGVCTCQGGFAVDPS